MLFFYIRHGDPIYKPNQLTPLGKRQAAAVAKRLALFGIDEIYSSTSNRAIETAQPTFELVQSSLKTKEIQLLDFCNEAHAWEGFTALYEERNRWVFSIPEYRRLFCTPEIVSLGNNWYEHPKLSRFKPGMERVRQDTAAFFEALGYKHIEGTGCYEVIKDNEDRVALFAHQGFGLAFLSAILDVPYPTFCTHFDMTHSGMTVIEFKNEDGIAIPRMLTLSSDSHLYREGLPLDYSHQIRF